jgi:hypothetical protein
VVAPLAVKEALLPKHITGALGVTTTVGSAVIVTVKFVPALTQPLALFTVIVPV